MKEPPKKIDISVALGLNAPDPQQPRDSIGDYKALKRQPSAPGRKPSSEAEGETWNVWRTQGQFTNRLSTQKSEINKAIEAGAPLEDILLKALECIAVMTGEQLFFTANKEKLKRRGAGS